jgi:tRNA (adenine22-N1)-methyltransferase
VYLIKGDTMEIKGRLKLIADKIPRCGILADIGTDHAYIPVYAVLNDITKKALATDIRSGPVEIAQKNIRKYGLQQNIEARLGNGLDPVSGQETDVIVIAGMGGVLIQEILRNGIEKAKKAGLLILQPMNAVEVIRKWLNENGFEIIDEALAMEESKLYNVICSKWTGRCSEFDEYDYYMGNKLINGSDPLLKNYLEKKLNQLEVVINGKKKAEIIQDDIENFVSMKDRLLKQFKNLQHIGGFYEN